MFLIKQKQGLKSTKLLFKQYQAIFKQFVQQYKQLLSLPQNQITVQKLDQIFLIKYGHLCRLVQLIRKLIVNKKAKKHESFNQNESKLNDISQLVMRFNSYNCCLPLFAEDWQQLIKINDLIFFTQYREMYNRDTIFNRYRRTISSIVQGKRNKKILTKIKGHAQKIPNIHLIIQGVASSSQTFCAYYHQIQNINLIKQQAKVKHQNIHPKKLSVPKANQHNKRLMKQQQPKAKDRPNFNVKIITSTTLFGFLMCLGKNIDQIRKDMYKTRNYLFEMFNPQKIMQSYRQNGPCVSINSYNAVADNYKLQILNVMKIFQQEYQKQHGQISYSKKFNDIRLIVQQQQHYYIQTCNQILNAAAEQIQDIEMNFLNSEKANEIAKKFGYDYTCKFNKRHQYSKYNKQCKQVYNKIIFEYYQQFGSIISAITCNFINDKIPFAINLDKAQNFTKGFMIARLMTTYKLKAFIFQKLQQHGLPYDITLSQFYERCTNKIIINFVVVNMTEKRIVFLNKITSPNMPVWAAILAASSLPSLHRSFQGQKNWENLQGKNFKSNQILSFFKDNQLMKRKYTLYSSAMLISSIPMELLTNNTFSKRLQQLNIQEEKQSEDLKDMNIIGFAFNSMSSTNFYHMKTEKKYFNLSFGVLSLVKKLMIDYKDLITTTKQQKHKEQHYNRSHQVRYNPMEQIKVLLFKNNVTLRILSSLIESNDNLVMNWYSDKLIRLPIKIGTLDFNQAIDKQLFNRFKLKMPSQKAKDALIRSYEITKTFIYNIHNCFKHNKLQYNQIRLKSAQKRFLVKLRAEFIQKTHQTSGFSQQFLKVSFLNHSKWNQNMYSNFIIEYKSKNDIPFFTRCNNSEIVWKIQEGAMLFIKIYYLHYKYYKQCSKEKCSQDFITSENSKIMYSEYTIDFEKMISTSHKDSYDYSFIYGWNQLQEQQELQKQITKQKIKYKWIQISAKKKNSIKVSQLQKVPFIRIKKIKQQQSQNKKKYCEEYIKQSKYELANST